MLMSSGFCIIICNCTHSFEQSKSTAAVFLLNYKLLCVYKNIWRINLEMYTKKKQQPRLVGNTSLCIHFCYVSYCTFHDSFKVK